METIFKPYDQIFETHEINKCWLKTLPNGSTEKYSLEDWYSEISSIRLSDYVPEEIHQQFDTAKCTLLYSWFSYRLRMVALLYSFSVVENALRNCLGYERNERKGLKLLLTEAIGNGYLNDSGFHIPKSKETVVWEKRCGDEVLKEIEYSKIPEEDLKKSVEYIKGLCHAIPRLRNRLAHGNFCLFPDVLTPIIVNSEIINMLFKERTDDRYYLIFNTSTSYAAAPSN